MASLTSVRARAYQVGFGDCLLLTFGYSDAVAGRDVRHMLIDFGSTRYPWPRFKLRDIAEAIHQHTDGHLDVLVATHRHKDHISGFGDGRAGDVIAGLNPRWIIRPWTDDPEAPADAAQPSRALDDPSREFAQLLAGARTFAAAVESSFPRSSRGLKRTLFDLAATQLPNQVSITALEDMARSAQHVDYVVADDRLKRVGILPGVSIRILGPPTLKQVPDLNRQRRTDADEFWFRHAAALADEHVGRATFSKSVYRELAAPDGLGTAHWLIDRLDVQSIAGLLRIVRTFDEAINNTSIVMLIDAGARTLLVSGDAQIENWSYTLWKIEQKRYSKLRHQLANVDLHKVGHHGSRNGTPKSLFRLWRDERDSNGLVSMLSTKAAVHGHTPETAVPRSTLVKALESVGTVLTTAMIDKDDEPWLEWQG